MKSEYVTSEDFQWKCAQCGCPLEMGSVTVEYMGNRFTTELARCPECKLVLVSEKVALGKMAEVEQILEDK